MFTPIDNHAQQAIDRLISQFSNAQNFQNFITAICGPIQELEDVLTQMNTERQLNSNSVGVQLDLLGTIIGLARIPGQSDASYLQDLLGQVNINTSQGQPEQVIATYFLFTAATLILLLEAYPATVLLESDYTPPDQATINMLFNILFQVLPAGVNVAGIVAFDPTDAFAFAGTLPGEGFSSTADLSSGGMFPVFYQAAQTFFEFAGSDPTGAGFGTVLDPTIGGVFAT